MMITVRNLLGLVTVTVLAAACSEEPTANHQDQPKIGIAPTVKHFGAMRKVMRDGQAEARIRLTDTVRQPHAYAVGALEGLAGEVTIIDGDVWVARVNADGRLIVTGTSPEPEDAATLLTVAHVANWQTTAFTADSTGKSLESYIERFARSRGIDTSQPFPFKMEGQVKALNLHVINGYCPIATNPKTQAKQPWRSAELEHANVTIIGFYAPDAVAVMTHHGTAIHAHASCAVDGQQIMGHIDQVTVAAGMTLSIPDVK